MIIEQLYHETVNGITKVIKIIRYNNGLRMKRTEAVGGRLLNVEQVDTKGNPIKKDDNHESGTTL